MKTRLPRSTGALILRLTFGYDVADDQKEDPLVNIVETAMQGFARASEPGAFLVDTFPMLKYIPQWFPGAGFQREAAQMRHDLEELYDVPYHFVKSQMVLMCPCDDVAAFSSDILCVLSEPRRSQVFLCVCLS